MKNKPTYSIDSVDHALRLAVLLQQEGPLGVTAAAARLGVARSTAHRLLTMLVYRDFAEQDEDRRYAAGPVLRSLNGVGPVARLRSVALPHLRSLVERTDETANVMVLFGTQVQMVATVECGHILRVGDREGRLLPAHLASGGRAILARLSRADLDARFCDNSLGDNSLGDNSLGHGSQSCVEREAVERAVRQTKRRGVAINDQSTEAGLTAIGHTVGEPSDSPAAAISLAMPTARYARRMLPGLVAALGDAARAIERDLRASTNDRNDSG